MIILGSDHAGWEFKQVLRAKFDEKKVPYLDVSRPTLDPKDDYPDIAFLLAKTLLEKGACWEKGAWGILICGTGTGMAIAANKVEGIRAATPRNVLEVKLARLHNNINVLCMAGLEFENPKIFANNVEQDCPNLLKAQTRVYPLEKAYPLVEAFLHTSFEGGRHQRRLDKITEFEQRGKG